MYDLRKMLKFSCIHEKKRKTKSSDLSTILKKLRGKIKSNKSLKKKKSQKIKAVINETGSKIQKEKMY